VLQEVDAPISPILGSRAQNHLFFAANIEQLAIVVQARKPDYVVVTKRSPEQQLDAQSRTAFTRLGYSWLKDGPYAAIAGRN
jgi:hypothetical protein